MARVIIIYNDISDINHLLKERNLSFQLHMRDACGSQSFWIEPLSSEACEGRYEEMQSVIADYFTAKSISVRFLEDGLNFVIGQP